MSKGIGNSPLGSNKELHSFVLSNPALQMADRCAKFLETPLRDGTLCHVFQFY